MMKTTAAASDATSVAPDLNWRPRTMCGLTGVLAGREHDLERLHAQVLTMTRALVHRGPDAEGTWVEDGVALGHRRLSILDLSSAGAQPMHSKCGRYVLVFNGEIYNHLELRAELESTDHVHLWGGHSDTETVLAGITAWGLDETLRRTAGMFALALWDRHERQLSLARDRMGEKPLYWGWAGRDLVFGSELKALRGHPEFSGGLCPRALAQYLRFAYVPAPLSIHPSIYKLQPGCVLQVAGDPPALAPEQHVRPGEAYGSISIRRFWSLDSVVEEGSCSRFASDREALEAVEAALSLAVSRQTIADVPLGAFLSGGIDSSLIVALMQARSSRPVQTFTIGFEDSSFDESPFAAQVARHLGTDHTQVTVTENETRDIIPRLPQMYDEPFADSSQIPTHLVCQAARSRVTVALSGDAGDELFGGYNRYFLGPRIWNVLSRVPLRARSALAGLITALPTTAWDRLGQIAGGRVTRPGDKAHRVASGLRDVRTHDDLYGSLVSQWPAAGMVPGTTDAGPDGLEDPLPPSLSADPAERMMLWDMRTYLPDDILCKVDRAGMAVSLETRVPFLDPGVLGVAARLPLHMKIRDGKGKWALRQLLYRHVPQEMIERPKTGFGIPVGAWIRGPLRGWAEELLLAGTVQESGLLDRERVRSAWEEHLSGRRDWTNRLWTVLMLESWAEAQA